MKRSTQGLGFVWEKKMTVCVNIIFYRVFL